MEQPELEHERAYRQDHRDRGPERRPGRRAEHVRVGQRVAQHALERRAGHRQPDPDRHRAQDARQPEIEHDRLLRLRPRDPEIEAEQAMREDRDRCHRAARTPTRRQRRRRARPRAPPGRAPRGRAAGGRSTASPPRRPTTAVAALMSAASSGWIAAMSARKPSASRGPGRVTTMSSTATIAPSLTAVIPPQPARWRRPPWSRRTRRRRAGSPPDRPRRAPRARSSSSRHRR